MATASRGNYDDEIKRARACPETRGKLRRTLARRAAEEPGFADVGAPAPAAAAAAETEEPSLLASLVPAIALVAVVVVLLVLGGCATPCGHAADMRRVNEGVDLILGLTALPQRTAEEEAVLRRTRANLREIAEKASADAEAVAGE